MAQIRHAGKLFGSKEGPQQPPKEDALAYSRVFLYAAALVSADACLTKTAHLLIIQGRQYGNNF